MWSFGVLIWEVLQRRRPFEGMDGFQIQAQWLLDPGMRLPAPALPPDLDPSARLVMDTLVVGACLPARLFACPACPVAAGMPLRVATCRPPA